LLKLGGNEIDEISSFNAVLVRLTDWAWDGRLQGIELGEVLAKLLNPVQVFPHS
jgi:hypothetical protein